jgi:hypothetical protein
LSLQAVSINELLSHIFEGNIHFLAIAFERWVKSSKTFRAFAETYRSKIRKKRRGVKTEEELKDLYFELETAYLLLQERRFVVEYEKYAAERQRSPDFSVVFRTRINFNVEVTRIRAVEASLISAKIMDTVCEKLGQLPPSVINVLMLASENAITEDDLIGAMARLRELAERKDEAFFLRRGFQNINDFHRQFRRLSAVIFRSTPNHMTWVNPLAKHPMPKETLTALEKLTSVEDQ